MLQLETISSDASDDINPEIIVRELKSQDLVTQMKAVCAARSIFCNEDPPVAAMVEAGIITSLVEALDRDDWPKLQYRALGLLCYIAFGTRDHTVAVANSGAIPKLLTFLANEEKDLAERVIMTLGNFALYGPETRDAVLAHGAVAALLPYLHPDTPIVQLKTFVRIFSNLCSHNNEEINLELMSPALPYIYDLLDIKDEEPIDVEDGESEDIIDTEPKDIKDGESKNIENGKLQQEKLHNQHTASDVVEDACAALANIMHGPDECIEAVQAVAGLTERLVGLLGHEATNVQEAALSAIGNMLAGTHNQVGRCLDANCLDHVVSLLQCSEPSLVKEAARAAGNILAGTHAQIQRALEKGILTALRSVLASKDPECRDQAMYAVTYLCYNASAAQHNQLVSSGVLKSYCALLAGPEQTIVVEVLDGLDQLLQAAERDGDVKTLCYVLDELDVLDQIQLQEHETDEDDSCKITKMIATLRRHAREERFIIHDNKIFTAVTIVQDLKSQDLETQKRATRAIYYFLREQNPPVNALLEAGIIPPLVEGLEKDACSNLLYVAAWALSIITAGTRKHRMAVVDSEALPKLLALLVHGDKVAELAACTLGDLALHGSETRKAVLDYTRSETALMELRTYVRAYCRQVSRAHESMVSDDPVLRAVPFVSELLNIEDEEILEKACLAFTRLIPVSDHHSAEAMQAMPGFIARIVDLLAYETTNVPEAALMVLINMLSGTDAQVDCCLKAGCLDHVISFLQSSEPTMVELAVMAASNIIDRSPSQIQRALDKGILTPLGYILACGEPKLQTLAAKALAKLCYYGSAVELYQVGMSGFLELYCALLAEAEPDFTLTKIVVHTLFLLLEAAKRDVKDNPLSKKLSDVGVISHIEQFSRKLSIDKSRSSSSRSTLLQFGPHAREEHRNYLEDKDFPMSSMAEIVEDLKSEDLVRKTRGARVVCGILGSQDSPKDFILELGVIAPLIAAMGRNDGYDLQLFATCAISFIANGTHKHRVSLVNGGAIPKLVALLSKRGEIAELAAGVLGRITHKSTVTRDLVLTHGAVRAILPHMRLDTPLELLRVCVRAYEKWCRIPVVSKSMLKHILPALPYIRELLESGDQDVLVSACGALTGLMCIKEYVEEVQVVAGLTNRIVALLGHEAIKVKEAALAPVANMFSGTDLQAERCHNAGCLELFLPILQCCQPGMVGCPRLSPDTVDKAVLLARNLLYHIPSQIQRALEKGILPILLNILTDAEPNSYVEFHVVCALASIGIFGTREHKLAMVEAGAIPKLVMLIPYGGEEAENCARALAIIAQNMPETSDLVLGYGAVEAMLPYMRPDTPLALMRSCISTYSSLCQASFSMPSMSMINLVLPALPYITELLELEDTKVLYAICEALSGLMYGSHERTEAVEATPGLIARIVSLLRHEDTSVKKIALTTVNIMLSATEIKVTRCVDDDSKGNIRFTLQNNEPSVLEQGVGATSEMLGHKVSKIQRVLKEDILTPLLHILANSEPKSSFQHLAIKVLVQVTLQGTREQRMAIVQSGAIPKLVALLPHGADIAQMAIGILGNFANEMAETCEEMLEHEIVPAMLPFMRVGIPSTLLTNCVETFRILCRHDDNKEPLEKIKRVSPALPQISELLNIGDEVVLRSACSALGQLMKTNEGIEAVQAVPGLTARFLALLGHEAAEVKSTITTALMFMLTGTDTQVDRCLAANCVEHVTSYLRCRDPSLMQEAAEATLDNLGAIPSQIQRALDNDILTPFMTILACPSKGQKRTVKAITNLYRRGSAAQREQLVSSGVLEPYCALLAGPDRAVVVEVLDSLDVLLQLADNDGKLEILSAKLHEIGVLDQI